MFGKKLILISMLFAATACAEPKYLTATAPTTPPTDKEVKADCSIKFKNSDLCLAWAWEKYPTESDQGSLTFKIYRANIADGTAVEVDPATLPNVLLWMPSMGHGSSPTTVTRLDVGTYVANNVFFVMPGEWQIKFQIKVEGVVQDEAVVSLIF